MKGFFTDDHKNPSMIRLLAFGCFLAGSFIAIAGVYLDMESAVWAGTGLAAVGIAGKTIQKKAENG